MKEKLLFDRTKDACKMRAFYHQKILIFSLMALLMIFQQPLSAQEVWQVDELIKTENTGEKSPGLKSLGYTLYDLVYESTPSAFIINGEVVKSTEQAPVYLNVRLDQLQDLSANVPAFETIQIIRVLMNDQSEVSNPISLDSFSAFPQLRYLFILSNSELCPESPEDLNCQNTKIKKMIAPAENFDNDITIVYKVSPRM